MQVYGDRAIDHMPLVFIVASIFLSTSATADGKLIGTATSISGDTIEVQGQRVRLYGVIAPGLDQLCVGTLAEWRCGMVARLKLGERIGSSLVVCHEEDIDRHGNVRGRCRLEDDLGVDLNRWAVASGWALASGDHGQRYQEAEQQAKSSGAGLWRDGFEPSDEWRRIAERAERKRREGVSDCSSCTLRHRARDLGGAGEKPETATK